MLKNFITILYLSVFGWLLLSNQTVQAIATDSLNEVDSAFSVENKSVEDILYETIAELGYNSDHVSVAFYDFVDDVHYYLNSDKTMIGASTTKVATAALYTSLINDGYLTYDTQIPFVQSMYEDGGGNITNSPIQDSYSISDLIYEMLVNSDNTAWNLLTNYYFTNLGNHQIDMLMLSGANIADPQLYDFNYINAEILEGVLIEVASSDYYSNVIDIMLETQPHWLLKNYVNDNMAVKYGYLEEYYHDTGIYFDTDRNPQYVIVVMTEDLGLDFDDMQNEFFGLINLRLNRWFQLQHS